MLTAALGLVALCGSALAQTSSTYTDPDNGIVFEGYTDQNVTVGFALPPINVDNEFLGEIIAPVTQQWVGIALGGTMLDNLLLVAWPYGENVVYSPRYATSYTLPTLYDGPVITSLVGTYVNETYWKWVFRCQNCTTWEGGSLNTTSTSATVYWVSSNVTVEDPASANSSFTKHNDGASWDENFVAAQQGLYWNWF
ncbi:hypothetical protein CONPUDRAFT_140074 [Coniophora puteana RWD-64-598 SS2]|uniref:DOMON domain-containing protein n=1 Tax=Coniophora puteana (strain RWD-64-598) TaxID=741705 RepID=A0A5M3M9K1_CONPW|nr:uncharacterized protein CONPUDRAFT_140074 [Coniophora puteana RWD-64-598 SS2]EIW75757.1 hypothetical protein CONPUDRAFT_140074 [Coniophora puteana RWD-64-598 SS2]